jgi:murein DD-endopeptidase MepM/ murein hydrolase activator NlpD
VTKKVQQTPQPEKQKAQTKVTQTEKQKEQKPAEKKTTQSEKKTTQVKKSKTTVATLPDPPKRSGKFIFPVKGQIISDFGVYGHGRRNDGINISAKEGTPFNSAEHGVVAYAGNELKGFGNLILVKHSDGWISAYAHAKDICVEKGKIVKQGEVLGHVGSTGNVKTPQLHFEIYKGTKAVNPMNYLKK